MPEFYMIKIFFSDFLEGEGDTCPCRSPVSYVSGVLSHHLYVPCTPNIIGKGDGGMDACAPQNSGKIFFSGNYHVKFGQKCLSFNSKLTELLLACQTYSPALILVV